MISQMMLVYLLGVFAVGAVLFVAEPYFTGSIKAEKRREALRTQNKRSGDRIVDTGARRKQITESLKEIENKGKRRRKITLEHRIGQAGLTLPPRNFYIISAIAGGALGLLVLFVSESPIFAVAAVGIGGLGLPHWVLRFKGKRRINRFVEEFPNAIDVIVRGIRAGLPLADCMRVIASESAEPVRSEFRFIVESQAVGLSLAESVERIVERIPISETSFFAIVIAIQQKAGGNLSEALGNLSRVLRERRKMRNKVKAVASEANASAMIIGSMPFVVGVLIYLTSPHYIELLWTTGTGRMMMVVGAIWMSIGIAVMKKMIAFEI